MAWRCGTPRAAGPVRKRWAARPWARKPSLKAWAKPPFRSCGRTAGGRRQALTMPRRTRGLPPGRPLARRSARAISMGHYQRDLVLFPSWRRPSPTAAQSCIGPWTMPSGGSRWSSVPRRPKVSRLFRDTGQDVGSWNAPSLGSTATVAWSLVGAVAWSRNRETSTGPLSPTLVLLCKRTEG